MNERIKQLAMKSGCRSRKFTTGVGMYQNVDSNLQQFAELIIKECTNMLPADSIRNNNGIHMFYVIREHFGVSTNNTYERVG